MRHGIKKYIVLKSQAEKLCEEMGEAGYSIMSLSPGKFANEIRLSFMKFTKSAAQHNLYCMDVMLEHLEGHE